MDFRYGAVLKVTRRDTLDDIKKHFRLMRLCGMNTVVIWPAIFWWEEKKEGYPFNTGREILDIAGAEGIKVIMELAGQLSTSEYIPDFLMKPEYYAVTEEGHKEYGQSAYGFLNYFHPEVKELIYGYMRNAARAYRDYPALLGYDLFNETMFRSFDKYTEMEFRCWLKEKYTDIAQLNAIWERTYSDWNQVGFERWKWMSIMPEADLFAFRKASIGRFLADWKAALESEDNKHLIVADNIHSMVCPNCDYERPQDDFDLKRAVGEIGTSFYPKQVNGSMADAMRWEVFDAFFAASRRDGFYVAEMQTHNQAIFNPTTAVTPEELKRWCYEAYAAGAKGITYWMWRPFDMGQQTFARGIVDYKGRTTPRYQVARDISKAIDKYDVLRPVKAECAILYDPQCEDFQRRLTSGYKVDQNVYLNSIYGVYKALFDLGIRCDIITIDELNDYSMVFVSNQILVDKTRADKLRDFTVSGGKLVIDGKFGVIDDTTMVNAEVPGALTGEDFLDTSYDGMEFSLGDAWLSGSMSRDIVKLTNGEPLALFKDGYPAIVKQNNVLIINTHLFYGYAMYNNLSAVKIVEQLLGGEKNDVKVRFCENDHYVVCFMFNYGQVRQQKKASVTLNGCEYLFKADIKPGDSLILESKKVQR